MIVSAKCPFCGNEVEADVFYIPSLEGDHYEIEPLESFCECDDHAKGTLLSQHQRALIRAYDDANPTLRIV